MNDGPLTQLNQVAPCPRCGALDGWYEKRVCKYVQMFDAEGEPYDATNMERVRGGDRRYCMGCQKDITAQVQPVVMPGIGNELTMRRAHS